MTGLGRRGWHLVELVAASAFAVAQPLLSVYGRSPDEFIYRGTSPRQIVAFAFGVAFAIPLAVWIVEVAIGAASRRAAAAFHVAVLACFGALVAALVVERVVAPGLAATVAVAAVGGLVVAWLYTHQGWFGTWLRFASVAAPVFVALFLLASSVAPLVRREPVQLAAADGAVENSVVLVVFDEWPTSSILDSGGAVDTRHFPNLARLAATSTFYRNATSITNSTWHALPEILTGQLPRADAVPEAYSHPESLFTLLGRSHQMDVSETVTRICPAELCAVEASGTVDGATDLLRSAADVYGGMLTGDAGSSTTGFREDTPLDAAGAASRGERSARDHPLDLNTGLAAGGNPERFDRFLTGFRADEGPTLHVLHMLLPHVPYRFLASGLQYGQENPDLGRNGDLWSEETPPVELANEQLLIQAAYVDALVGDLLDRMQATGVLDRAMLVVTADHGIAFEPGGPIRGLEPGALSDEVLAETLWRPLFVKAPGQRVGRTDDANVMGIDLVPTIAEELGVRIPWEVDGVVAGTRLTETKLFTKSTVNAFGVGLEPIERLDGSLLLRRVLARNIDALAPAVGVDDPFQLFRVGPYGDLVGRAVPEAAPPTAASATATIEDAYEQVDRSSGEVPALLVGSADADMTVVVSVNGVVAGAGGTFADGPTPHRFAVMVPDALLRDGGNELRLFELASGDSLVPLRLNG